MGNEWHTEVFWFNRTRTNFGTDRSRFRICDQCSKTTHLQVQKGKFLNCPNFTGLIGSLLHSVNTDHGWSGTLLLFRKGGKYQVCGLHIAGAVDGVPANVAVSAYSLNALLSKVDAGTTEDMPNCPFDSRNVAHETALDEDLAYVLTVNPHSGDEMRFGRNTKRGGRKKTGKVQKKTKRDFTVSNSNYVRFKQAASTLS